MLPSTDRGNALTGCNLDNSSSLHSETPSQQQLHFELGKHDSNGLSTSSSACRLDFPLSPTNSFMSKNDSLEMAEYAATTTGTPAMGTCVSKAGGRDSNKILSMKDPPLCGPDLHDFSQPENQYHTIHPVWMHKGQQQQLAACKDITLVPELARLDTQLPQECLLTYETCYGQITPLDGRSSSKGSPLLHGRESMGSAISFTSLDMDQLQTGKSKPIESSSALVQAIGDLSQDLHGTRKKSRQQHKAQARNGSTAVFLDLQEKEKREASLARNRVAASKCRERKKRWIADFEENERNLRIENKALRARKAVLTNELIFLKNKALEHIDCECEPIREYLTLSAREKINQKGVVEKDRSAEDVGD